VCILVVNLRFMNRGKKPPVFSGGEDSFFRGERVLKMAVF